MKSLYPSSIIQAVEEYPTNGTTAALDMTVERYYTALPLVHLNSASCRTVGPSLQAKIYRFHNLTGSVPTSRACSGGSQPETTGVVPNSLGVPSPFSLATGKRGFRWHAGLYESVAVALNSVHTRL